MGVNFEIICRNGVHNICRKYGSNLRKFDGTTFLTRKNCRCYSGAR